MEASPSTDPSMASPTQKSDPQLSADYSLADSPSTHAHNDPIRSIAPTETEKEVVELRSVAEDFPNMMKFSSSPAMLDHCIIDSLMPSPRFMQKMTHDQNIVVPCSSIQFEDEQMMQAGSSRISSSEKQQQHKTPVSESNKRFQSSIAMTSTIPASSNKESIIKPPLTKKKLEGAWSKPLKFSSTSMENHKGASCEEVLVLSINDYWPALEKQSVRKRPSAQEFSQMSRPKHVDSPSPITQDIIKASQEYPWAAKMKAVCNLRRVTTPVYMEDGTPRVSIPSHVLLEGIENQNQYVVGQFYRCAAPSGGLIHVIVTRIWGRKCRIFIRKLGQSSYLFHIPDESTRKWIIQRGIWHVDDCLMFVSLWSTSPTINLPEISTIPIWLTLKNIPNQLYSIKGIDWIASGIGEPMLTSKLWLDPTLMGEAKILVEVKLNKSFPQKVALEDTSGSITMVDVLYAWLPSKCGKCGHLGHKASYCLGIHDSGSGNVTRVEPASYVVPTTVFAPTKEVVNNVVSETILVDTGSPSNVNAVIGFTTTGSTASCTESVSAILSLTKAADKGSAHALESQSTVVMVLPPTSSIETDTNSTETIITPSAAEIDPQGVASLKAGLIALEAEPIIKVAQDATEIKQGNPLSLLLSDLDSTPPISGKMATHMTEDNEEESMSLEGNQFALLNQSDMFEDSFFQTSRGGRPIKPTQKVQEMLWAGRGNRGRQGCGGRG